MIIKDKVIVKNYKCFDSGGGGFEKILPINIVIGKNNSGKSSLIDLVQFLIKPNKEFLNLGRNNSKAEVFITHMLTEQEIGKSFRVDTSGGGIPGINHFEYGKRFVGDLYTYQLYQDNKKSFIDFDEDFVDSSKEKIYRIANVIQNPFLHKTFCKISAERDITPEVSETILSFASNGRGATNTIQQILNRTDKDSFLVENKLLDELNIIINPDIKFARILVQLNEDEKWELFFEDDDHTRIALSKMGSGIKTILLVLLNLIVKPILENNSEDSYVFAFEELENNLHPSLQRRLYNYIIEYSEKYSAYFFITTHSNVVIDIFSGNNNSQIIHIVGNDNKSEVSEIISHDETKRILSDLGIKASDILQSNGVIWVEGPSDRNYLNRWLQILEPKLQEGLHYSIMFYGGRLLANLSFDFKWFNKDVIPLLKINQNAFVVIDRDGKSISTKLNNTKKRINEEIGHNNCWITKGREIENYLSSKTITEWLLAKHGYKGKYTNNKDTKIEENILKSNSKIKLQYNFKKTVYSSEITEYINNDSLDILDLEKNLKTLIEVIKKWNK